jgi:hypothetical protein
MPSPRRSATATAARPSIAAPVVHTPSRARSYVIVACKLAVARFELQLCRKARVTEQTQTGPREIDQYFKTGEIWVVRGTAYPEGTPPKGYIKRPEEVLGYSITKGIPRDFFEEWMKQYGQTEMVKNRLIYACDTYDEIEGEARENEGVKDAFSPLDMPMREGEKPDSRIPHPLSDHVSTIEKMVV